MWKEKALDNLLSKDERGPSSIKRTLEPFQRRRWRNVSETEWSAYELFRAHWRHLELNWISLSLFAASSRAVVISSAWVIVTSFSASRRLWMWSLLIQHTSLSLNTRSLVFPKLQSVDKLRRWETNVDTDSCSWRKGEWNVRPLPYFWGFGENVILQWVLQLLNFFITWLFQCKQLSCTPTCMFCRHMHSTLSSHSHECLLSVDSHYQCHFSQNTAEAFQYTDLSHDPVRGRTPPVYQKIPSSSPKIWLKRLGPKVFIQCVFRYQAHRKCGLSPIDVPKVDGNSSLQMHDMNTPHMIKKMYANTAQSVK